MTNFKSLSDKLDEVEDRLEVHDINRCICFDDDGRMAKEGTHPNCKVCNPPKWTSRDIVLTFAQWVAFVAWLYLIVEVAFW